MQTIGRFFRSLLGQAGARSKLEESIFNSVEQKLDKGFEVIFKNQLAAINKIHRSPDFLEVNLYVVRNGKSDFPKELCFDRDDEFKLAVVDLQAAAVDAKLQANIWCVNGHVFSIEYKSSCRDFERAAKDKWQVKCQIQSKP